MRPICLRFRGKDQVDSWGHRVQDWNSLLPAFRDSREVVPLSADPGLEQGMPPSHWPERDSVCWLDHKPYCSLEDQWYLRNKM